jgi:hypothetical protein
MHDNDLDIGGSGKFSPYLKFNSKENAWSWRGEEGEVSLTKPVFVMDLANIQTGWLRFDSGAAPDRAIDVNGVRAPRPSDRHKRGFICRVFSRTSFNGVGEFSSNASSVCTVIRELYKDYRSMANDERDKVPVIAVVGSSVSKGRNGTFYAPTFMIKTWVPRPPEVPDEPVVPVEGQGGNGAEPIDRPVRGQATYEEMRAKAAGSLDDQLEDEIPY